MASRIGPSGGGNGVGVLVRGLLLGLALLSVGLGIGPGAGPARAAADPQPAGARSAMAPLQAGHLEYGFNAFLIGNSGGADFNAYTTAKVGEAGFGWVRLQLSWSELEPSPGAYNATPYDTMIAAAAGGGAKVLVSVAKAPAWANPALPGALPDGQNRPAFGSTMRFLAARYRGKVQAWEIWNEQNMAGEVGGNVDVGAYAETLSVAYQGVKAVDPGLFVLFGGLTPTGANDPAAAVDDTVYLQQFYGYAGGLGKSSFDVLGSHAGGAANPPDTKYPDNPGSGDCPPQYADLQGTCWRNSNEFYFRRVEDQRAIMAQNGDAAKQVWLTEFGWDACQGLPAPSGYAYCLLVSERQQADYLSRALAIARDSWPWAGVMFVWNLNYAAIPGISPGDEKYAWSVVRADWSNRPAFDALKASATGQAYTLTIAASPAGGGAIAASPPGPAYTAGTTVTLTAAPNAGYSFAGWAVDGAAAGSANPLPLTMNTGHAVVAVFAAGPAPPPGLPPATSGLQYYPLPRPVRLHDTRPGQSACLTLGAPLPGGAPTAFDARRPCSGGVPAGARAIAGNGTVVNAGEAAGYVTLWPGATPQPVVSNLNYRGGQIVANAFTVGLGSDGGFALYAYSTIDFVVDVAGCYAP